MHYVSTRGGMAPATYGDILLEGLAPDGGLVVPAEIPQVDAETLESWRGLTYPRLAATVLGLFFVPLFYVAIKRVFPDKPKGEAAAPSTQEGS